MAAKAPLSKSENPPKSINDILASCMRLEVLSIGYLAFPVILFLFGWLKPVFSVPCILLVLWTLYVSLRDTPHEERSDESISAKWMKIIVPLLAALFWVGISGIGGFGHQNGDYNKHNSLLSDLTKMPWPLIYNTEDLVRVGMAPVSALIYSITYYLPGGIGGLLGGWELANVFLFIWGCAGMALAIAWFTKLTRVPVWIAGLVFPFLGGMDFLSFYWFKGGLPRMTDHIEWWNPLFQYSANSTLLMWVPQHAFAGWTGTGMLVYLQRRGSLGLLMAAITIALVAYGTAFAGLGLAILIAPFIFKKLKTEWRTPELAVPAILAIILALFVKTNQYPMDRGFLWFFERPNGFFNWLAFCVLEFGLVLTFTVLLSRENGERRDLKWLIWCGVFLTFLPLFKLGLMNDLVMRVSIPPLMILGALAWHHLYYCKHKGQSMAWLALAMVLSVNALSAWTELYRGFVNFHIGAPNPESVADFPHSAEESVVNQYFAAPDSFFFKALAKRTDVGTN